MSQYVSQFYMEYLPISHTRYLFSVICPKKALGGLNTYNGRLKIPYWGISNGPLVHPTTETFYMRDVM